MTKEQHWRLFRMALAGHSDGVIADAIKSTPYAVERERLAYGIKGRTLDERQKARLVRRVA